MACSVHTDRDDVAACVICTQPLCEACLYYANSEPYCRSCVSLLEKEYEKTQKKHFRRTLVAIPVGMIVALGAIWGWRWYLLQTEFSMSLFTPIVIIGFILGMTQILLRIAGAQSLVLFGAGVFTAAGIMLGGEYITYDYQLFTVAQKGISAEKLLRFSEQYSFNNRLNELGIFDYLFFLIGFFITWRHLWPARTDNLDVIEPTDLKLDTQDA